MHVFSWGLGSFGRGTLSSGRSAGVGAEGAGDLQCGSRETVEGCANQPLGSQPGNLAADGPAWLHLDPELAGSCLMDGYVWHHLGLSLHHIVRRRPWIVCVS